MKANRHVAVARTVTGTVAAVVLLSTGHGLAQSSGVTGHAPPAASGTEQPVTGEPGSRLPLIDPEVFPPGGLDPQEPPPGDPGAAGEGQPGRTGQPSQPRTEEPMAGEPGSRLPLIDPEVFPPGGLEPQEPPPGEPGAADSGEAGQMGKPPKPEAGED